jgi:hypothetical protein
MIATEKKGFNLTRPLNSYLPDLAKIPQYVIGNYSSFQAYPVYLDVPVSTCIRGRVASERTEGREVRERREERGERRRGGRREELLTFLDPDDVGPPYSLFWFGWHGHTRFVYILPPKKHHVFIFCELLFEIF